MCVSVSRELDRFLLANISSPSLSVCFMHLHIYTGIESHAGAMNRKNLITLELFEKTEAIDRWI